MYKPEDEQAPAGIGTHLLVHMTDFFSSSVGRKTRRTKLEHGSQM